MNRNKDFSMAQKHAGWTRRIATLLLAGAVFGLCYTLTNGMAYRAGVTRHIVLAPDAHISFLPWMVAPYMTSGLLFAASFLAPASVDALRVHSQRVLFCTVGACLLFALYPLRFGSARPPLADGVPARLFELLALVDQPYNQFPSLHVAYCVVFAQPLMARVPRAGRPLVAAWLALVAASTLFTYQHHVIDVLGGVALGVAAMVLFRRGANAPRVGFHYLLGAGVLLIVALAFQSWAPAYPIVSMLLVALAYGRGDAAFLRKRGGVIPPSSWLLYGPYLAGYWLTWQCVRWRERARAPVLQLAPLLWVGRRLAAHEAALLPPGCQVIDLANELNETPPLRTKGYRYYPLFDLLPPPPALVEEVRGAIATCIGAGQPVYLHCAMGYSRSIFIAKIYLANDRDHPARGPLYDHLDLPAQTALPAAAAPDS
jgi:membrane-associated phospholipid phosphatase